MKAKPAVKDPQHDLFRIELDRVIDRDHELCQLAELIDLRQCCMCSITVRYL